MAHRWLVTLAMFLVTAPVHADQGFRVEHERQRIMTSTAPLAAHSRSRATRAALALPGDLIAVDRAGALDVVDRRTGATIASAAISGIGIASACRAAGDTYLKTSSDLVAISGHGEIRWVRPTTVVGTIVASQDSVIDAWVDRVGHRFGIASYDPRTGRRLASLDLGSTGGWYDHEHVQVSADGPHELLVSSAFALEG